jgi:hypothetical protein
MIALEDCMAMCGLTAEEVEAIAEHEHIPEIAAAALGDYLLHKDRGPRIVRDMIRDDIRAAIRTGDALMAPARASAFGFRMAGRRARQTDAASG